MAFCYRVRLSLAALAIWPAGGAVYGQVARPPVPAKLSVPNSDFVILKALGKGKQIYRCGEKAGQPRQFAWTLDRPEADLLDADGHVIGRHFKGPAWESSDGSKVAGQVIERADAPRPDAVPWLLLKAAPNTPNPAGGVLARVSYIQRVDTEGGMPPAGGCDESHLGAEASVDYQAVYYFYAPR